MKKRGSETTPRSVAVWAASLVFLVGVGTAGYFLEVRGVGIASEIAAGRGLELALVACALLAGTALSFAAISNLAQQARSSSRYRRLVRRALEVDYADSLSLREFDAIPDLRELVGVLAAEKSQSRELGDRLESLRGEIDIVVGGMQRSAGDLGKMRQESLSEIGNSMVSLWNALVERVRAAEVRAAESQESANATTRAMARERHGSPPQLHEFEERLQAVEASLIEMRQRRDIAPPAPTPAAPLESESAPMFEPSPTWRAGVLAEESEPGLEIPHFVGLPAGSRTDRIEVSYESPAGEEVEDLPASALFFESEPEASGPESVFDLREFGALELEE